MGVAVAKVVLRYSILPLAELRLVGEGEVATSKRQANAYLSRRLRYVEHHERAEHRHHPYSGVGDGGDGGDVELLDLVTRDPAAGITLTNHFSVYMPLPVLRSTVEEHNPSGQNITLQLVSSLVLRGLTLPSEQWWKEWRVRFAHNAWFREGGPLST
jgi:hypothetical protein